MTGATATSGRVIRVGTWVNAIVGATTGMVIAGATTITGARIITIMKGAIVNTISTIISTMRSITGKADVTTIAIIATMTTMIDGQRPSARLIPLI
jgi:predicted transcriptional regulator